VRFHPLKPDVRRKVDQIFTLLGNKIERTSNIDMLQLFVSHFVRVPPSSMFGDEMQHTLFRLINVREEHLCCSCQHPMGGYAQLKKQGQSVCCSKAVGRHMGTQMHRRGTHTHTHTLKELCGEYSVACRSRYR